MALWSVSLLLCSRVATAFSPKRNTADCVQWTARPSAGTPFKFEKSGTVSVEDGSPQLCRPTQDVGTSASAFNVGFVVNRSCLLLGDTLPSLGLQTAATCDPVSEGCVGQYEYSYSREGCSVWWREVAADVIPPIPELTLAFGMAADPRTCAEDTPRTTSPIPSESPFVDVCQTSVGAIAGSDSAGNKLGLCRTLGDHQTQHVDGGDKQIGIVALEGERFGRCTFKHADGSVKELNGGLFHILSARSLSACSNDDALQAELSRGLEARVRRFLTADDQQLIEKVVTGSGSAASDFRFHDLVKATMELGSCELEEVLSPARFVPSDLNPLGLHLLREVLAERMYDARVKSAGFDKHPDYLTWKQDGVLFKDLDDPELGGDHGIIKLLQMVSGEAAEGIPQPPLTWTMRNVTVQAERDQQTDVHIDTFAAITKVWVFPGGPDPPAVTVQQGPLMYVKGSHRSSEGRLRWMHAYAQPPAKEALREPSFRLRSCVSAENSAKDFVDWAERNEIPVLPLPGTQRTLVIADTSGLHRRGVGTVGQTRHSWRLDGDNDGGLKRLDPFRWLGAREEL